MSVTPALPDYVSKLIPLFIRSNIISFGSYTLKNGRISPYFFNLADLYSGPLLSQLARSFAAALVSSPLCTPKLGFDVIFGPAYKGISLACTVSVALSQEPYNLDVAYSFNRKEVKDHGEGGSLVGSPLKGKRVLIIDDVITAGTAKREAYDIITKNGGQVVGLAIVLDRQERGDGEGSKESALQELGRTWKVPVITVVTLDHIIEYLKDSHPERLKTMEDYRKQYGV